MTSRTATHAATRRRWLPRLGMAAALGLALPVLAVGGIYGYAWANLSTRSAAPTSAQLNSFDGRYLLSVSDADMVSTAYADAVLQQIPGVADSLNLLPLPLNPQQPQLRELPVSNSVQSWPQVMAASADGNTVYVAETRGQADDSIERFATIDEMPAGRLLTRIDLRNGSDAATQQSFDVVQNPSNLALSPDERWLAIGSTERDRQLVLLPTATLGDSASYRYLPMQNRTGQPADEVHSVAWHPSGRFLAVGINRQEVQFFAVNEAASGAPTLTPHGPPLTLGESIALGRFTPDGRHYITADLFWGNTLTMLTLRTGELMAVAFDADAADSVQHTVAGRVQVGQSPEGWTMSPDGRYIVTVNMLRSYLPDWVSWWPGANLNSLSLVELDPSSGALTRHGEYGFEGLLPEDAVFDRDGDALATVIYEYRPDSPPRYGAIEFWNVVLNDGPPRLERSSTRLQVNRGPHTMLLIP